MVLHELAHAYHHQVLGYDNPDIKAAYRAAMKSKSYESVLFYTGVKKRAYACNSDQEYFAELTEAYFSTNDFYPFVRAEIIEHDRPAFKMLKKVWGKP
jgi:dipeptidyl-peptidase-4